MSLAEQHVLGAVYKDRRAYEQACEAGLQPEHFENRGGQLLYRAAQDAYASADTIDVLAVVDGLGDALVHATGKTRDESVKLVEHLMTTPDGRSVAKHAAIVKKDAQVRFLKAVGVRLASASGDPEAIAAEVAREMSQLATGGLLTNEIISYGELADRFFKRLHEERAAKARGEEIGIKFGLRFLDSRLNGLRRSELMILAGTPGSGKSAVVFNAARSYAQRQMKVPAERRGGALIFSLEMGEELGAHRFASSEGGVDSARIRQAEVTDDELGRIARNWLSNEEIPLYLNFTSLLRPHQIKAMVSEAKRKHNVQLVIVDHQRYFVSGQKFDNAADEDEAKTIFLKEEIAKELDVAVILLAHTTKAIESDEGSPKMSHLRGGFMVAAHADFLAFAHRPWLTATEDDRLSGRVSPTDAVLSWPKNRHGLNDPTEFVLDPSVMLVRDI